MKQAFELQGSTVLIIDDEPDNSKFVATFLERYGAEVVTANSGVDGLAKARLRLPDLILLDVMMPGMDGYQVCQRLSANDRTQGVPVIFLTALSDTEEKIRAFEVGGVDYLVKPLVGLEVVARVNVHLKLYRAMQQAEAASRAKSEFLANMNHEIRTPMNAVLGYASLLQETDLDSRNRGFLAAIQSAGRTLMQLIDDVLDLSRIESGRLELEFRPTNLRSMLLEMERLFAHKVAEKSLVLEVNWASELPAVLELDDVRLRQILLNLIGNAIKFTNQGGIRVAANYLSVDAQLGRLEIVVQDTGIGIPEDQQQSIFDSFTQCRGQRQSEYGGTGLGLAICRQLADLMGGVIRVASAQGFGSTFSLLIPEVRALVSDDEVEDASLDRVTDVDFNSATILLADADEVSRQLLVDILYPYRFKVLHAKNGEEAVAIAQSEHPDFILMSVNLPVLSGTQAAARLEQDEKTANIPIIAMTASVTDGNDPALRACFADVLFKPLTKSILINKLLPFLSHVTGVQPRHMEKSDLSELGRAESALPKILETWRSLPSHPSVNELEVFGVHLEQSGTIELQRLGQQLVQAAEGFDSKTISSVMHDLSLQLSQETGDRPDVRYSA